MGSVDIIIFALIAAFFIFKLRNTLGKRDGFESDEPDHFQGNEHDEQSAQNNVVHLHDTDDDLEDNTEARAAEAEASDDPLAKGVLLIQMADPSFSADGFAQGAKGAFEMVLNAYSANDTHTLKGLLSSEVYNNFLQAIRSREQAGEVLEDTLVDFKEAEILEAYMEERQAFVTVKFKTEQVNVTRDENGDVVDGNPNEIITVTDIWTFARDTRSRDPNWSLVATRSLD